MSALGSISVIIPVLNEATGILSCLEQFLELGVGGNQVAHLEIIVVDGGSTDGTLTILETFATFPIKVLQAMGGRANQMNRGAAIATGEILLFLHGDTRLPASFRTDIQETLNQHKVIAGAFPLRIDDPRPSLRWVERAVQWRSQYLSLPYGDQGIFLRAADFWRSGGYAALPIMEDYELIQRLKKQGKISLTRHPVLTSPRRWQTLGVWRTTAINQLMILGYHLGIPPQTLRQWYRQQKPVVPKPDGEYCPAAPESDRKTHTAHSTNSSWRG